MNIKMIVRSLAESVFISSLLAVSAWAASPTLSVGSASGSAGTSAALPVAFDPGTASVSSLQFNLTLPAGLSAGTVTNGAIVSAAGDVSSTTLLGNTWKFIVYGGQTAISSGTLLTVQLIIAPGTAAGNLSVPISGTVYSDPGGNSVPTGTNTGGTVTVTAAVSAPVITSALTASGTVGGVFSYQIAASNSPTSFNATGLPAGLSVNTSNGLISGTPSAAGTSNMTISATNAGGTGSVTLALTVSSAAGGAPALALGSGSAPAGTSLTLPITFNPAAVSVAGLQFSLTLPAGLSTGTVAPGPILTASSKTLAASLTGNTWTFIAYGAQTAIGGGTLLTVQLNIPLITPGGTLSVPISGTVYADPSGASIPAGTNTGGTVTVTPATITPPTVAIVPLSTTTVSGTISLTVAAFSSVGIAWVQFQLDGSNMGSPITAPPFALSWNTLQVGAGTHSLTAVATDIAGNKTTSAPIMVTVVKTADATPGLRNALVFPNPAVKTDPVIRAFLGWVDSVEITVFDLSGHVAHSATLTGAPSGTANGQYYYDYKWTGTKASGTYFAVIHGKAADGTVIRARTKFAVVR